ncbi:hypothetical protein HYW54_01275 [Candidatus Gottesmanbacteria bacterium]|nr:hypothetical protein [Candidatus Gottesmanbacteria bacterium]
MKKENITCPAGVPIASVSALIAPEAQTELNYQCQLACQNGANCQARGGREFFMRANVAATMRGELFSPPQTSPGSTSQA